MRKNYLLFFIIVAVTAGSVFAQDSKLFATCIDFEGTNRSFVITGYNGTGSTVVIPASIDGIPVRKIGDGAFRFKGLTKVDIPEGVEVIGHQAFFGNQLELVVIPSSVKEIAASAFDSNMLRRITSGKAPIADGTPYTASANYSNTTISVKPQSKIYYIAADKLCYEEKLLNGDRLPNYCNFYNPLAGFDGKYKPVSGLQTVSVPAKNTTSTETASSTFIEKEAVPRSDPIGAVKEVVPGLNNSEIRGIYTEELANNIIKLQPDGGIGKATYRGKGFDIIVIPEGTTYIGEAAFYSNHLTSVRIPDSVRFIGSQAFMGNNLTSITIGENVTVQLDSFRYQFSDYYRMNKFKAGTYILKAGHWNYGGIEPGHKLVNPN
jgi:hypothetical protein